MEHRQLVMRRPGRNFSWLGFRSFQNSILLLISFYFFRSTNQVSITIKTHKFLKRTLIVRSLILQLSASQYFNSHKHLLAPPTLSLFTYFYSTPSTCGSSNLIPEKYTVLITYRREIFLRGLGCAGTSSFAGERSCFLVSGLQQQDKTKAQQNHACNL